jgi:hypothetical protein
MLSFVANRINSWPLKTFLPSKIYYDSHLNYPREVAKDLSIGAKYLPIENPSDSNQIEKLIIFRLCAGRKGS